MAAVIRSGSRQLKVSQGDIIKIEKVNGEVGDSVKIDKVLMAGEGEKIQIGAPTIPEASVTGVIVEQGRDKKIIIFKHKRRKNHRKKRGHRQYFTRLEITEIKQ